MTVRAPEMPQQQRQTMEGRLATVFTCLPGVVTSWDAGSQKASVQIGIRDAYLDETNARKTEEFPIINGVPVAFQGGKSHRFTFPISDGSSSPATTGAVLFFSRSVDRWLAGDGQTVDPQIDHLHDFNDAMFIPGLNPFGAALQTCPTDKATIGSDTLDIARIEFTDSGLNLGAGAAHPVTYGDNLQTLLTTVGTALTNAGTTDPIFLALCSTAAGQIAAAGAAIIAALATLNSPTTKVI